jgi:hypothetical protein
MTLFRLGGRRPAIRGFSRDQHRLAWIAGLRRLRVKTSQTEASILIPSWSGAFLPNFNAYAVCADHDDSTAESGQRAGPLV